MLNVVKEGRKEGKAASKLGMSVPVVLWMKYQCELAQPGLQTSWFAYLPCVGCEGQFLLLVGFI